MTKEQFTQLDRFIDNKYKIISIVIMKNQNVFYILLHTKHTDDYIFSKRYKLNCNGQELKNLLNKIRQFYLMFDFLF